MLRRETINIERYLGQCIFDNHHTIDEYLKNRVNYQYVHGQSHNVARKRTTLREQGEEQNNENKQQMKEIKITFSLVIAH